MRELVLEFKELKVKPYPQTLLYKNSMQAYEEFTSQGGGAALKSMCRFFAKAGPVYETYLRITQLLNELTIPYAVIGGMALNAHGYVRATIDVDILVNVSDVLRIQNAASELGFMLRLPSRKNLRDTKTGVKVDLFCAGDFPGDGKPGAIEFPNPATCAVQIDGVSHIRLEDLINLKLAAGMGSVVRIRHCADAMELIKICKLKEEFAAQLHPYVREKYLEYWRAVRDEPDWHSNS